MRTKAVLVVTSAPGQMKRAGIAELLKRCSARGANTSGAEIAKKNWPKTTVFAATATWLTPPSNTLDAAETGVLTKVRTNCSGPPMATP